MGNITLTEKEETIMKLKSYNQVGLNTIIATGQEAKEKFERLKKEYPELLNEDTGVHIEGYAREYGIQFWVGYYLEIQ